MDIKQQQNQSKGIFYVEEEGKRLAELQYSMANNNLLVINHTEVNEILQGKNVGKQLVNAAANFARTRQYKILQLCSFAKAVMKKRETEFADVLQHN